MYYYQLFEYEISFPFTELCVANFLPNICVWYVLPEDDQVGRKMSQMILNTEHNKNV